MKFLRSGLKSSRSDEELIQQFRESGDKKIISTLFERYIHLVFGVCMKYLKDEDESKDAALEIFEKLSSDLQKHGVAYFKSWLYMVAKNHCLMKLRHAQSVFKKNNEYRKDEMAVVEYFPDGHQEKLETEYRIEQLDQAITELNPEQKQCIELFYLQEKSYVEIAEITGFTMMKVKSYIQNGKRNLKILLTQKNEQRIAR